MSSYSYGGFAPYVPVAERRRKAALAMAKLAKKGQPVAPVKIEGRKIAASFWGKAWCDNLESYRDYANRLPRGRTYVRNGSVIDLQIEPLAVKARVSGSSIYTVSITIAAAAKAQWQSICGDCAGGIDSLVELLQGRLSKGVMERLCDQNTGLFPKPSEIEFSCSCPDHASMCKHVAAALYGVGARLDQKPDLLFRLRAVDETDLIASLDTALPLSKSGPKAGRVLEADDLSALFGLDMAGEEAPVATSPASTAKTASAAAKPKAAAKQADRKEAKPKPAVAKARPADKRAQPGASAVAEPKAKWTSRARRARDR